MTLPTRQRLGGIFLVLVGGGFTAWIWQTKLAGSGFYVKSALWFPAMAVLGLGLILFPGYREERAARGEDLSKLQGVRLITPRWWVILGLAMAAGGANLYFLSRF